MTEAGQEPTQVAYGPLVRVVLVCLLAFASPFWTKLALPAGLLTFLCFLSVPLKGSRRAQGAAIALGAAALAASVGLLRFLVREAVPGMVEGGTVATEQRAISRLREIVFAEDGMRKLGRLDPDHDGVGSALLLPELTGERALPGGLPLSEPPLEGYGELQPTHLGPAAAVGGFFFIVCVPEPGGGFGAEAEHARDAERAERAFFAYAWPEVSGRGLDRAYAIDADERIWRAPAHPGQRLGPDAPPRCDDVTNPATRADWHPWRHKRPRDTLPGAEPRASTQTP